MEGAHLAATLSMEGSRGDRLHALVVRSMEDAKAPAPEFEMEDAKAPAPECENRYRSYCPAAESRSDRHCSNTGMCGGPLPFLNLLCPVTT